MPAKTSAAAVRCGQRLRPAMPTSPMISVYIQISGSRIKYERSALSQP